jgi:[FeFe] hydrogenase H-cluster maturation GTPase HydF
MTRTPKSLRLHIALLGRRNVGKSSLLNAITRQQVSIVSPVPGTTTDPVEKPMELLPLGPVLFIDTAGVDDSGELGALRVEKTRQVLDRADLAVLVSEAGIWGTFEAQMVSELQARQLPVLVVFNKADLNPVDPRATEQLGSMKIPWVQVCAREGKGIEELRRALLETAPADFVNSPAILGDLVGAGEMAVLVVPIDKEAPKGRLILPQVQAIRDLLDSDAFCLVVKERELRTALERLRVPPKLVVTDSQAFLKVAADTPGSVPLTSFSILMSRFKGDLVTQVQGAMAIDRLQAGDRILVAEACSHHPIGEDIGRVKIPRWLTQYVGGALEFVHVQGHDFPADLSPYRLVIHCGACMWNRREMLSRILKCQAAGVPVTNYGLTIAYSLGIFERALAPFPAARDFYQAHFRLVVPPFAGPQGLVVPPSGDRQPSRAADSAYSNPPALAPCNAPGGNH